MALVLATRLTWPPRATRVGADCYRRGCLRVLCRRSTHQIAGCCVLLRRPRSALHRTVVPHIWTHRAFSEVPERPQLQDALHVRRIVLSVSRAHAGAHVSAVRARAPAMESRREGVRRPRGGNAGSDCDVPLPRPADVRRSGAKRQAVPDRRPGSLIRPTSKNRQNSYYMRATVFTIVLRYSIDPSLRAVAACLLRI